MYWTHPYGSIPNRNLIEVIWRGGHRHGDIKTPEARDYDRWWRKRVLEIVSNDAV